MLCTHARLRLSDGAARAEAVTGRSHGSARGQGRKATEDGAAPEPQVTHLTPLALSKWVIMSSQVTELTPFACGGAGSDTHELIKHMNQSNLTGTSIELIRGQPRLSAEMAFEALVRLPRASVFKQAGRATLG